MRRVELQWEGGTWPAAVFETFWERWRGLMGRRSFPDGLKAVLLPHTPSIHTGWMAYPIDVAYLDRGGRVLRLTPAMPPWRFGPWVRGAWWTLEAPAGALRGWRTGQVVRIREGR